MADEVQRRGGSAADHKAFTGAVREWTHDDDLEAIRVHDGATAGGFLLLRSGEVESISGNKTLALADFGRLYDVDTSAADVTVTLPAAADATEGWQVMVRKADPANKLTIATNASETIDGDSSRVLLGDGEAIILRSDGTNWVSVQLPAIKGLNPEHATDSATDTYVSATNTTPPADGVKITRHFQDANETPTPTLDGKTMTTRDGSALWPGAVSGVHDVQYDSGADTYLVLEPIGTAANVNNAPVARDSNGRAKFADPSAAQDVVTKAHFDAAEQQRAQAWVNFDGTGTVSIRDHYNVSSITDNGTGDYTVNFSSALADANYSFVASAGNGNGTSPRFVVLGGASSGDPAASSCAVEVNTDSGAVVDVSIVCVQVLGGN